MVDFHYETNFSLDNESAFSTWIAAVLFSESKLLGELNYIFCDDEYLLQINIEHLGHDTYTDIISFDYTVGNEVSGDIFISVERVLENALQYGVAFEHELRRVMCHGVLHYCGYMDKTADEASIMRSKEDQKIAMFHVEH